MRGMNSGSVDLIYLDPPFKLARPSRTPLEGRLRRADRIEGWGLDDVNLAWHCEIKHEHPGLYALLDATRAIHGDSMMSYLIYMAIRVMEMRPRIGRLCCLQPEAMIILLDKRAGINARDKHNRTSLHYAIDSGCVATGNLLIRAGDHLNVRTSDHKGSSALRRARSNSYPIFQSLKEDGAR